MRGLCGLRDADRQRGRFVPAGCEHVLLAEPKQALQGCARIPLVQMNVREQHSLALTLEAFQHFAPQFWPASQGLGELLEALVLPQGRGVPEERFAQAQRLLEVASGLCVVAEPGEEAGVVFVRLARLDESPGGFGVTVSGELVGEEGEFVVGYGACQVDGFVGAVEIQELLEERVRVAAAAQECQRSFSSRERPPGG